MKFNSLNKKVIKYWSIKNAINFIVTLLVFIIFTYIILNEKVFENITNIIIICETIYLLFLLVGIFIIPKLKYYWYGYILDKDKFAIRKGFLFIKTTVIPIVRIQHVETINGPIIRKFKLNKIRFSTASGTFDLEGLSNEDANNINEYLKNKLTKNIKKESTK